jgi:hypothetical protein
MAAGKVTSAVRFTRSPSGFVFRNASKTKTSRCRWD